MWAGLVHSVPNLVDLIAITTSIGTLACRLWVVPCAPTESPLNQKLLIRLWWLLLVCLVVLTLSSVMVLIQRTAEMSGRPYGEVYSILFAVMLNSHYGQTWLIRVGTLVLLWIAWLPGKRNLQSRAVPAFMLAGALVIAFTRSASGHGADAGDLSLPELMDWFHLLAASAWGGGMVAFTAVIFPTCRRYEAQNFRLIADLAGRLSFLAGISLAGVLLTGAYNYWLEVASVSALWATPYGNILAIKLLLVLVLIILGASNRYVSIPLLKRLAGYPPSGNGGMQRLALQYLPRFLKNAQGTGVALHFAHTVMVEVIVMAGVLVCAALLTHETPAKHQFHRDHTTLQAHSGHESY